MYEQIKSAIIGGKLKQGDHIVEMNIAEQMGISRAPVREAIRQLQQEGLVVTLPHKGTFVSGITLRDAKEIFSLRIILERFAVNLAIHHIVEDDVKKLYEHIELMRAAAKEDNLSKLVEYDMKFHEVIYKKTNHNRLQQVLATLNTPVRAFIATTNMLYSQLEEVADGHLPIVKALVNKDAERAAFELERHIVEVGEQLLNKMQSDLGLIKQRDKGQ